MSPEQLMGKPVEPRTDIWSMGVILYELLTGDVPFLRSKEIICQIISNDLKPPSQICDTIPKGLEEICMKCLEKNSKDRFSTAQELGSALKSFLKAPTKSGFTSGLISSIVSGQYNYRLFSRICGLTGGLWGSAPDSGICEGMGSGVRRASV